MENTPAIPENPPAWWAALPERERKALEKAERTPAPGVRAVLAAVAENAADRVAGLAAALSQKERRSCARLLTAWSRILHETYDRRLNTLVIAAVLCQDSPASVADRIITLGPGATGPETGGRILEVLADRPGEWLAAVAHHIVTRDGGMHLRRHFPLVEHLILLSDTPVSADRRFVLGWMNDRTPGFSYEDSAWPDVVEEGSEPRAEYRDWDLFVERLRADPLLDRVLPHVFEAEGAGHLMRWNRHWAIVLSAFAGSGRVDRAALVDGALGRLLRPGRPDELRGFRELLDALAPTGDEYAARVPALLALLSDTPSSVAGYAQKILVGLDEAGRLSDEHLAEASASVLFRTEKTLVRAQLSWLDRAARRDRSRAGVAVLAAADAFGHPDPALQERALALVERHLKHAGDAVRADLAAAAEALSPALRPRAAELPGVPGGVPGSEAAVVLPAVPEARPVAPPVTDPAEAAIEINAILVSMRSGRGTGRYEASGLSVDVPTFERVLDGLVRCAHTDRDALLAELRAVAGAHPSENCAPNDDWNMGDVRWVVAEVLGEERSPNRWDPGYPHSVTTVYRRSYHGSAPLNAVLRERLREVAGMVAGGDGPPFLLAVPTLSDGRIDPAVLVDRIAGYERLGVVPGGVDLSQALLRVDTTAATEGVLADARRLSSEAGAGLAAWLEAGGLPEPEPLRSDVDDCPCGERSPSHLLFGAERLTAPCALHEVFGPVLGPARGLLHEVFGPVRGLHRAEVPRAGIDHWPAVVPTRRELVALRLQEAFAGRKALLLPELAAAHGQAGPVLHMGVACGLGSDEDEHRTAAVDALLVLAARGDLDTGLLAREVAEAARWGTVRPESLAGSMRSLIDAGLHHAAWEALEGALPFLIDDLPVEPGYTPGMSRSEKARVEKTRKLADVFEVAVDCAHLCGARGGIPQVDMVAGQKGSSRLLKEARRLRAVLGGTPRADERAGARPAPSGPRPVAPPVTGAAEAAAGVAAVLESVRTDWSHHAYVVGADVPVFERVLDGLVRCAHTDRDALLAELRAVAEAYPWRDFRRELDWNMGDVRCVVAEALGEARGAEVWDAPRVIPAPQVDDPYHGSAPLNAVLRERLREVAGMVAGGDGPPFLLAVPTLSDGRIDPAVLVDRIAGYERLGVVPGGVDLSQALLRVDTGAATEGVLADARRLSSEAGAGLAAWLEAGGLPEPVTTQGKVVECATPREDPAYWCGCRLRLGALPVLFTSERSAAPCALHEVFAPVLAERSDPQHHYVPVGNIGHWPAVLPLGRELVAVNLQSAFVERKAPLLPELAAAHGQAGPVLHMGVACALLSDAARVRMTAVDALLAMAGRGDLDAELLARLLVGMFQESGWMSPFPKAWNLARTVREATRGGAHAVVWRVLVRALPGLLADAEKALPANESRFEGRRSGIERARSTSVVLAEAVECARRSGARGEIPELSAAAALEGPAHLVKEARRLRDALAGA
ncbi:DUF6493 family protein [Actinorugispora endophytica]|uniref:HEAT repeat protein n=1 Tax=Actinorugispora endophytica TaxID=1605990 RepID=A0A4R6V368_9ACTN|nr:DUF6493 family protein [Actinorugispora endophytica]TDQ54453.1 hypothetical protein EV190_102287 [Actinorugispora endophytica]